MVTARTIQRPITLADAKHCPVTLPHSGGPPGIAPDAFFGWGASYGNGTLWVGGLWPRGVIEAGPDFVAKDGSVGMKFGWWRAARGKLTITDRRLDAPAPPARGLVPTATAPPAFRPAVLISRPRVAGRSPGRCPQAA